MPAAKFTGWLIETCLTLSVKILYSFQPQENLVEALLLPFPLGGKTKRRPPGLPHQGDVVLCLFLGALLPYISLTLIFSRFM